MQPEQITQLLQRLDQIVFLLQAACIGISFIAGFVSMQFIIHAKNQKHLF